MFKCHKYRPILVCDYRSLRDVAVILKVLLKYLNYPRNKQTRLKGWKEQLHLVLVKWKTVYMFIRLRKKLFSRRVIFVCAKGRLRYSIFLVFYLRLADVYMNYNVLNLCRRQDQFGLINFLWKMIFFIYLGQQHA